MEDSKAIDAGKLLVSNGNGTAHGVAVRVGCLPWCVNRPSLEANCDSGGPKHSGDPLMELIIVFTHFYMDSLAIRNTCHKQTDGSNSI